MAPAVPAEAQETAAATASARLTRLTYDIDAKLDTTRHVLTGTERIHFTNTSPLPLPALYFHLYLNAFRDERSVFMREGGGRLRQQPLGRPGGIEVERLVTGLGEDLSGGMEHELVPYDSTQLRVNLPTPLPPGAALDLELTFRAELPELVARAGYAGEFYLLGQWFPKLAKLGSDGEFVSFPYHGFGEFFADFADYTWSIELPARFQVASSGELVERSVQGSVRRERYRRARVHDVAWAAYPYFIQRSTQVGKVRLDVYAPRGYEAALERQSRVLAAALPFFEAHYGAYPYSTLTAVLPTREARGAAGMEYPTFFTSDGPWWALPAALPDPLQDVVSVHELAHQWFAGIIASNEVAHPMLDEGLAEWSALDFLREYYVREGSWTRRAPFPQGPFDVLRAAALARMTGVPSSLLSADRYTDRTLAPAVYVRPALVLARIAELHRHDVVQGAVGRYARKQRFRHPTPNELYASFDHTLTHNYGHRVLRPSLAGEAQPALQLPDVTRQPSPSGWQYLPELWSLAFGLLRGLGP